MEKFSETIKNIELIVDDLEKKEISAKPLKDAVESLKKHESDIQKIESNIDAIQNEVVSPIRDQLDQNKLAGKFSVFGFWIGALALIVAILTDVIPYFFPTQIGEENFPMVQITEEKVSLAQTTNDKSNLILSKLNTIERRLIFPEELKLKTGDLLIERSDRVTLGVDRDGAIKLELTSVVEYPKGESLKAGVRLYRNNRALGRDFMKGLIRRVDGSSDLRDWFDEEEIALGRGDKLTIGRNEILVEQILSERAGNRSIGDTQTAILLKIMNKKEDN